MLICEQQPNEDVFQFPRVQRLCDLRQGTAIRENEQGIEFMFECKSGGGSYLEGVGGW
jgi:hypothetical protein